MNIYLVMCHDSIMDNTFVDSAFVNKEDAEKTLKKYCRHDKSRYRHYSLTEVELTE